MAERVYFHVGIPKSGTTYVQQTLWHHRERLAAAGVLLPADGVRDHRWGALAVRQDPRVQFRPAAAATAWDRVLADVAAWSGTAVISHEFYGGASAGQASAAVDALAPAEVHLVVTARHPLQVLCSGWQEMAKYGNTVSLDDFSTESSDDPAEVWNWRALDVGEVLGRWGDLVPPERVHVLCVPSERGDRAELWEQFAGLFVEDPSSYDPRADVKNASIGLVECEVLRRIGPHVAELTAQPRSTWVRNYLAETLLAARERERFWPGPHRVQECRRRGDDATALIVGRGFHVVGDLDHLRVPADLEPRRTPEEVSDTEVADVAAELVASVLADLRVVTRRSRAAAARSAEADRVPPSGSRSGPRWRSRVRGALGRLRRVWPPS